MTTRNIVEERKQTIAAGMRDLFGMFDGAEPDRAYIENTKTNAILDNTFIHKGDGTGVDRWKWAFGNNLEKLPHEIRLVMFTESNQSKTLEIKFPGIDRRQTFVDAVRELVVSSKLKGPYHLSVYNAYDVSLYQTTLTTKETGEPIFGETWHDIEDAGEVMLLLRSEDDGRSSRMFDVNLSEPFSKENCVFENPEKARAAGAIPQSQR